MAQSFVGASLIAFVSVLLFESHALSRLCSTCLTALPVYNERKHVDSVLDQVVQHARDVLVVDDGSSDGTSEALANRSDVYIETHDNNRGYGAALSTAFAYALRHGYEVVVTIDCDGQHEPQRIKSLFEACREVDIVSGSRYLNIDESIAQQAPSERRRINHLVTQDLNRRLGLSLTDAFCGLKAYRVSALRKLRITEKGYAMPLELWVQAAHHALQIKEVSVPLIYLDEERSFGGSLDHASTRMAHYREVIDRAIASTRQGLQTEPHGELCPFSREPC